MSAGIKLFGRDGYAVTSIDAICSEAGLTKRYFYESFASNDALLIAAYRTALLELMAGIQRAAAPHLHDAKALVHAGLLQTFTFVVKHPDKARLIMIEAMSVRSHLGRVYGEGYDQFVQLLVAFTKPFLADDGPGDIILSVMAKASIGSLIHLSQGWIASDFKQPIEELVQGMEWIFAGMAKELGISAWGTRAPAVSL